MVTERTVTTVSESAAKSVRRVMGREMVIIFIIIFNGPGQCCFCFELYLIVYCQLYLTVTSFKTVIVHKRNGRPLSGPQNSYGLKVSCSH